MDSHDLLKLFEGLSAETRNVLEAACSERTLPPGIAAFVPEPLRMRRILAIHHDTFVRWRYPHEPADIDIVPLALDAALTAILEACEQQPSGSAS